MKPINKRTLCLLILSLFFLPQILFLGNTPIAKADDSLWNLVSDGGLKEVGTKVYGSEKPRNDVRLVVANIIKVFLGFLGIIFLVLIILAGYKWMTAGGNEENVKQAKSQIVRATIGLLIILAAYSIATFVTNDIRKAITGDVW